jgi:hypothetical protein
MAGHVRYTALLDACVLYPTTVADALTSLSVAGLFGAKWTVAVENEFIAALEEQRPELAGRIERRRGLMRSAIPDWEVVPGAYEALVTCLRLPDPKDVHILAALPARYRTPLLGDGVGATARCAAQLRICSPTPTLPPRE